MLEWEDREQLEEEGRDRVEGGEQMIAVLLFFLPPFFHFGMRADDVFVCRCVCVHVPSRDMEIEREALSLRWLLRYLYQKEKN